MRPAAPTRERARADRRGLALAVALALEAACSRAPAPAHDEPPRSARDERLPPIDAGDHDAARAPDAGAPHAASEAPAPVAVPFAWLEPSELRARATAQCAATRGEPSCVFAASFSGDAQARRAAEALWARHRIVATSAERHELDGGYRGVLELLPQLPEGKERAHLERVLDAFDRQARFFEQLEGRAGRERLRYRYRPDVVRFVRSREGTRPSAYASGWTVTYNVRGFLLQSAAGVDETMFHEVFHLNDAAHGRFSERALAPIFDRVVARCATKTPCLAPYSPGTTKVRNGTFYSFQPGNGVGEYGAELSLRYYLETRAALAGAPLAAKPFKCGPRENGEAWRALVDEMFGGVDVTPSC